MSGLTEFLLARIAEDEAKLDRGLHPGPHADLGSCLTQSEERRWLAECEAKRELIALDARGYDMEPAMMYLAAIYAGHPDYREEWRP